MPVDKLVDSAQLDGDLTSVANAIRSKGSTSAQLSFPYGMASAIEGIKTKEIISWHQCPVAVKNYLDQVTYNPNDYSTSRIAEFAHLTAVVSNTKPVGKTVDGVTYYNEVPNVATPFSSANMAGTIQPLDRLRWINTSATGTPNVRDLGGWSCDGGTVKYGMLFRGGILYTKDRTILVDYLNIHQELDLQQDISREKSALGDDVMYYRAKQSIQYTLSPTNTWKEILSCIFDNVIYGKPVYFHCYHGADRTATLACILEGVLGVSQSDIDKDYELTSFYSGTDTAAHTRARNESDWVGLINQIKAFNGTTFRDKCVNFVASLGFTAEEINAFRAAMIAGNPETVTPDIDTFTVTNNLSHATSNNLATDIDEYQPYNAIITPNNGYVIDSIIVRVNDVDVTSSVVEGVFEPSGTIDLTENGMVNVRDYRYADVVTPTFNISKNLANSICNNTQNSIISGQSFGAVVVPENGYALDAVSVKMNGVDVTSTCAYLI